MTTTSVNPTALRGPELLGQTVVLVGGSGGIGLATAHRARSEGADVVLVARSAERLKTAAAEVDALSTAAFDASDPVAVQDFFDALPGPVDHVLVTAGGSYYAPLDQVDFAKAQRDVEDHLWLPMRLARSAAPKMRPGGTLIFMSGSASRRPGIGLTVSASMTGALPLLIANLALELAPIRVNLIAAGFVDSPLSASLLGDGLEARRAQLRSILPIGRVVEPADVAALAVHLMANTALTGATYDIDGGQQLVLK